MEIASLAGEHETLSQLGAQVLAISADSLDSHLRFCEKLHGCPFPLASDHDLEVARLYDVVDESGKRSRRAIFIIDQEGFIVHEVPWYNPASQEQYLELFRALGLAI